MRPGRLLEQPPWRILGGLVVLQWLAVAVFAASVEHNGWYWFQGGDQMWYWTIARALADGQFGPTNIGWVWSMVLAPIARFAGPNFLVGLPAIVAFQFLILLPLALVAFYALVQPLLGRRAAYGAAALWVVLPYALIPLFDERYYDRWVEQLLPQMLGLTVMADFPSLVAVLGAGAFLVRGLIGRSPVDVAAAGILTGVAIGVKPANAAFVPAALLALALGRRWRDGAAYVVAIAPFVSLLAVWKFRGTGVLPLLSLDEVRLVVGPALAGAIDLRSYVNVDWGQLAANRLQIREFFFSLRLVEWLPLAGTIALARRSVPVAALVAGWLVVFVVVKGSVPQSTVESGSFFRLLMPSYPALLALVAALPLLVPGFLRSRTVATATVRPLRPRALAALAAAALVPSTAAIALTSPVEGPSVLQHYTDYTLLPVDPAFELRASRLGSEVHLDWDEPPTAGTRAFYTIFRVRRDVDIRCGGYGESQAACVFDSDQIAYSRRTRFVDRHADLETYTYRVGLSANWRDYPAIGDVVLLSQPALVPPARRAPG
jgi:hypothetical protein